MEEKKLTHVQIIHARIILEILNSKYRNFNMLYRI